MMNGSMQNVALVTGASSGFGRMIANDLARAGCISYASMLDMHGKNAKVADENAAFAKQHGADLRSIELDVQSDDSISKAIGRIIAEHGRLDVMIHNAGHMVYGPTEAFTTEQLAEMYDINVLGTHRVNRAVLPHMRGARSGLLVWVSSTSVTGGVPPLLGPYFAAKAGMDALAVCYAKELAPFGIETSIIVPGSFTTGTNHFANGGKPDDVARNEEYEAFYPANFATDVNKALAATAPKDADPTAVGRAVVDIVSAPFGKRPLRVYVDPADDGAAVSFQVIDRIREQFLYRIGYAELLHPAAASSS